MSTPALSVRKGSISSPQLTQIAKLEEEVERLRGKLALVRRDILAKDMIAAYEHACDPSPEDASDRVGEGDQRT